MEIFKFFKDYFLNFTRIRRKQKNTQLNMLARFTRSAIVLLPSGTARAASTIPVEQIARVVRMHVKDEEHAMKADALFQQGLELFRTEQPNGFVSAKRTVCKAEWAYELELVFTASGFKEYMESDFREKKATPILGQIAALNVDGEVYQGNRVFDAYSL